MRRGIVFLLLFVLVGAIPASTKAESGAATVTIHYRSCPYGYVHQEYEKLCRDNYMSYAQIGFGYGDGRYFTDPADVNGDITDQLEPGVYYISAGAARNQIIDQFQSCTANRPEAIHQDALNLRAGDVVTCNYYVEFGNQDGSVPSDKSLPPGDGHIRYFGAVQCQEPFVVKTISGFTPFPAGGCNESAGIKFVVTTGDGQPIGTCVTESEGYCGLHVFVDSVIVSEDVGSVRSTWNGYAPQANPILFDFSKGVGDVLFVDVPASALPTVAPANSSITVHGRVCPPGYTGQNYFADCHGNPPDYSKMMFLQGQLGGADYLAKTVDADGNLIFSQLLPESYQLMLGLPPDTVSTYVACSKPGPPQTDFATQTTSTTGWSSTSILLGPGEDIVCDAYTIPPAA